MAFFLVIFNPLSNVSKTFTVGKLFIFHGNKFYEHLEMQCAHDMSVRPSVGRYVRMTVCNKLLKSYILSLSGLLGTPYAVYS